MSHSTRHDVNNEFNFILRNFSAKTVISPIVNIIKCSMPLNFSKPRHIPLSEDKKLPYNRLMIICGEPI
jgi:hypothetical protein